MILHIGDFAYEIFDQGGQFGDQYFARSSKSARRIPYIMTPGNHENYANGTLLNYRFKMPNCADNLNAMFDFVYKGTYFMFVNLDWVLSYQQWKNIEYFSRERKLLEWIDSRSKLFANRKDIKWRIFSTHRPFECTDQTASDCQTNMLFFRRIADKVAQVGFHMSLNAHVHSYIRNKVSLGLQMQPVTKLGKGAYMTVINGHAGTAYYYQTETNKNSLTSPLAEAIDVSGPTFLHLELSSTAIVGKLTRSDNSEVRDTFSITEDQLDPKQPEPASSSTVFVIVIACGLGIAAIWFAIWFNLQRANSSPHKGYSSPEDDDLLNSRTSI